jgi:hypothetical protein
MNPIDAQQHPVKDTSPTMHDPTTQSQGDYSYREALEQYFATSPGSYTEKLENFAKYVPRQTLTRFLMRYEIFKLIQHVQGSIVECGVLFGNGLMSFANLSAILEPYNFQRRLIGFDTFEGFPAIAQEDLSGRDDRRFAHLRQGGYSAGEAGYQDLLRCIEVFNMNRFLNHFPKVELVKGDFSQTAPAFLQKNPHLVVSCLYLDFDIYTPTKLALELFVPRMPKGAVIVFDELNEEGFPGETIAVQEVVGLSSLRIQRFPFEPRISFAIIGA